MNTLVEVAGVIALVLAVDAAFTVLAWVINGGFPGGAITTGWLWRKGNDAPDKMRQTAIDYLVIQGHTKAQAHRLYEEWKAKQQGAVM